MKQDIEVRLPKLPNQTDADSFSITVSRLKASAEEKTCGCEATALIVDDNAFNLIPLEVILSGLGIVSEQALGGQEAIDQFIANRSKTCCNTKF